MKKTTVEIELMFSGSNFNRNGRIARLLCPRVPIAKKSSPERRGVTPTMAEAARTTPQHSHRAASDN